MLHLFLSRQIKNDDCVVVDNIARVRTWLISIFLIDLCIRYFQRKSIDLSLFIMQENCSLSSSRHQRPCNFSYQTWKDVLPLNVKQNSFSEFGKTERSKTISVSTLYLASTKVLNQPSQKVYIQEFNIRDNTSFLCLKIEHKTAINHNQFFRSSLFLNNTFAGVLRNNLLR